jgi:peptidoglycan/xylan/chitin deacetylase (PgdA/CDA1 family)
LRNLVRTLIYRTGALSLYHRLRNRRTLTVVLFHRVLTRDDPRWETSLSPWTVADDTFDECLTFFGRHYALVTLDDVRASMRGTRRLPARSLLITFDDGFADNIDYALPLLRKHRAPATVFITSDIIGREERLWTEDLLGAFESGLIHQQQISDLHRLLFGEGICSPDCSKLMWDIVRRGPELDEVRAQATLYKLKIGLRRVKHPRQMLTREEIGKLVIEGLSIGAHGKTHTSLPLSSNVAAELHRPRVILTEVTAARSQDPIDALSFPHGSYTADIANQALAAGYKLLFTSEAELCVLRDGFLVSPLVGRIDVGGRRITSNGKFRPEVLATSLFRAGRRPQGRRRANGQHRTGTGYVATSP